MVEAAASAVEFAADRQRAELDTDRMLLFAIVRALEIVGEAAGKLSADAHDALPHIPWRAITGMRNRLIHGYFDIDTEVVWRTVTDELPPLITSLREALHDT